MIPRPSFPRYPMMGGRDLYPPLQPPPLPPMFPWMSAALAASMTSPQSGKSFEEQASNLPFVPIIVNDADLAKMTENVKKEAEQIQSHQLQYYKDVLNQDLPQPLKDMFQPLYCKLCTLTLSSPVVAKDHYTGKRHKKGIEAWFLKNIEYTKQNKKDNAAPNLLKSADGNGNSSSSYAAAVPTPCDLVANRNAPSSNNRTSAPPPPSFSLSGTVTLQQQQSQLQPLIPGLISRKRSAVGAPAPPPPNLSAANRTPQNQNNTQQLSSTDTPKYISANLNALRQPPPPPPLKIINSEGSKSGGANPIASTQNLQTYPNQQTLSTAAGEETQPPKKPRWESGKNGQPQSQPGPAPPGAKGLCRVCNVHLSSTIQADQHFKGKAHAARVTALMEQGETNLPPPILPPPSQPKPQSSGGISANFSEAPSISITHNSNNNNNSSNNSNNSNNSKPFIPRGGGFRGGPPRFSAPNSSGNKNSTSKQFNTGQRGRGGTNNNGRFERGGRNGPRFR